MDGFWVISMAFSLPFADVADKLAPERPTSSILGPHTLSSVLGVLAINFGFTVLALGLLFGQDWFKCRKWVEGSVADVTSIGDNYETEVVFIVSGYQYISSAMAYNFGFKHLIHFTIVLYPSTLSCFFRVNCDNDDVVRGATVHVKTPIQNPWNTTVMPVSFRYDLLIIIIMNAVALSIWEYFFVNGPAADYIKSFFPRQNRLLGGLGFQGTVKGEAAPLEDGSARLLAMVELEGGVIGHRERRSVDSVHPDPVPDN
ncbi:unnamed protein product [Symbiodinium microadriaticum]|nr:unnamed protein product [Symbiodinium microadriaticum]